MLKRRISIIIASVLALAMATGCTTFGEDYVAKVGAEKITKSEYNFFLKNSESKIQSLFGNSAVDWTTKISNMTAAEYAKQMALDGAVDLKIQVMKAKDAKMSLTKKEIDDLNTNIDASIKNLGTTGIDQEKALKAQTGVTAAQLKSIYKDITLMQNYAKDIQSKYKYSDEDLKTYYDKNKDGLFKVTVGHVLFLTVDANNQPLAQDKQDAAKKNADDILAKVNASGSDFAALAKQYSEDPGSKDAGGTYTLTKNGQMVKEFEDWAFDPARKVGDTGIVKTTYGYHVMKMEKMFTYDELKDDVKASFTNKKYSDEVAVWKKDTKYAIVKNQKVLDLIKVPLE